jgi:hypothetical protein
VNGSTDDAPPDLGATIAAALAVRQAHHDPPADGGTMWPRCDECGPASCPALTDALKTLADIRDQLTAQSARPDNPLLRHLSDWSGPDEAES